MKKLFRFSKIFFLFLLSSAACFALHQIDFINPVMASSVIGLIGFSIAEKGRVKDLDLIFYCGSFAGMSSAVYFSLWWKFVISALLGALLLITLEKKFVGWGGKLGAIAFLSLVIFNL